MSFTLEDRLAAYGRTLDAAVQERSVAENGDANTAVTSLESVRRNNRLPALAVAAALLAVVGFLAVRMSDGTKVEELATNATTTELAPHQVRFDPQMQQDLINFCTFLTTTPGEQSGSPFLPNEAVVQQYVVIPIASHRSGVLALAPDYVRHCDIAIAEDGQLEMLNRSGSVETRTLDRLEPDGIRVFGGSWGDEISIYGQFGTGISNISADVPFGSDTMVGISSGYFQITGALAGNVGDEPSLKWTSSDGSERTATITDLNSISTDTVVERPDSDGAIVSD